MLPSRTHLPVCFTVTMRGRPSLKSPSFHYSLKPFADAKQVCKRSDYEMAYKPYARNVKILSWHKVFGPQFCA